MGKIVAIVVVALLAFGGVAAYVILDNNNNEENQSTSQQESSGQQAEQNASEGSFDSAELIQQALAGGDAVECSFEQNGYPGTAYVKSNSNFRVDAASEEGQVHIVKNEDAAYLWVEGQTNGFVFSGDTYDEQFDEQVDTFNPENFEEVGENGNVQEIDCRTTTVDSSLFELPEGINFQSMDELLQAVPQNQ